MLTASAHNTEQLSPGTHWITVKLLTKMMTPNEIRRLIVVQKLEGE